jgi:hypothetical protein
VDLLKTSCYVIYPSIPAVPFYPLYQYKEEDTPMSWLTSPESMWVAMVYPTQLRGNLTWLFFQSAKRVACLTKRALGMSKEGLVDYWRTQIHTGKR